MSEVYGSTTCVPGTMYYKFVTVEVSLLKAGINTWDYAQTVARLWKPWCIAHGLGRVPINVFLGRKSREWYDNIKLQDLTHTVSSKDAAIVLNDEVTVGMTIIGSILAGYTPTVKEIVSSLRLSHQWQHCKQRPIVEAVKIICSIVGVDVISYTYEEVARRMRERTV